MTIRSVLGAAALALLSTQAQAVSGGGFSLSIGERGEDGRGYVRMEHGAVYSVCFRNNLGRAADAELTIDGLPMGTWRLAAYRNACIERPADDNGRFTFYRAESSEGYAVGSGQVTRSDKGRVSVRFIPEVERVYPVPTPYAPTPRYDGAESEMMADEGMAQGYAMPSQRKMTRPESRLGAGVTGLTGESGQRFGTAGSIERDWADAVTLELRLVHDPRMDRPTDPRPLPGRYDKLAPPPV